jgi:acetyl esterase
MGSYYVSKPAKFWLLKLALILLASSSFMGHSSGECTVLVGDVCINTSVKPDALIPYEDLGHRSLMLHVFYAKSLQHKQPTSALLLFHGGGWNSGTPKQFYDQADYFSKNGLTVISVEYRKWQTDKTPPNVSVMDAKTAFRWVINNANALNVDPKKVIVGGASAGGHLAAVIPTISGFNKRNEKPLLQQPVALVLFNPVVDMSKQGFGYHLVKEYWREISPIHNITVGHPPTFTLLGSDDHVISVATANAYQDKIKAVGSSADTALYSGKKHGFFNRVRSQEVFTDTVLKIHRFLFELNLIKSPSNIEN